LWLDGPEYALLRLDAAFAEAGADAVLLFQRAVAAIGYDGLGDFFLDPHGVPRRRGRREVAPFIFSGVPLLPPRCFLGLTDAAFSLNRIYDRALAAGRLRAIVHDGEWYHVGTPSGLAATRARLASHRIER